MRWIKIHEHDCTDPLNCVCSRMEQTEYADMREFRVRHEHRDRCTARQSDRAAFLSIQVRVVRSTGWHDGEATLWHYKFTDKPPLCCVLP